MHPLRKVGISLILPAVLWIIVLCSYGAGEYSEEYAKGYEDALNDIIMVNLEAQMKGDAFTMGELANICRTRKGIPTPMPVVGPYYPNKSKSEEERIKEEMTRIKEDYKSRRD